MTASEIQYDTISDSKYHWKARNWRIRQLKGMRETITSGSVKDTTIMMEPADLVYSKGQQETFTSPQLRDYINKQIDRGSGNVVQYEVEYHKRIATSFASFILTTIGLSLSSRKRKGGKANPECIRHITCCPTTVYGSVFRPKATLLTQTTS